MIQLLIIDKQPVVRAGIRYFLQQTPDISVVAETDTYHDALALHHERHPDVTIMDLSLADHEGFEFARQVSQANKDTGLVAFAAQRNPILRVRADDAGIKGLIYKTDGAEQILAAIAAVSRGETYFEEDTEVRKDSLFWGIHLLTPREFEVFRYLAEGYTVIDIAGILKSSPKTVGVHQTRIIKKLGVENSAQLAHLALGGGVIELKPISPPLQADRSRDNAEMLQRRVGS